MRLGVPPPRLPPYQTVYCYFAAWRDEGITEQIHDQLRDAVRRSHGRRTEPTAAIIDSQSVKTSGAAAPGTVGFDSGKKIRGRKRHIIVDTLGLILAVSIFAASVQDSAGGKKMLAHLAETYPTVTKTWVDGGYNSTVVETGRQLGIDVEVVSRNKAIPGFQVLPRRWVVERTFGWLMLNRRLARDYETLPASSRTIIHWSMIGIMARTLTNSSTPSWRDETATIIT
jgi:transposase